MHDLFKQTNKPPRFDLITPALVDEALEETLRNTTDNFKKMEEELKAHPQADWEHLMQIPYQIFDELYYTWGIIAHLLGVCNSNEWREIHKKYHAQFIDLNLKAQQNVTFYKLMKELQAKHNLNPTRTRILDKYIDTVRNSGIELEPEVQKEYNEIQQELGQLSTQFSNNILDATNSFFIILTKPEEVDGLPPTALALAATIAKEHDYPEATAENGPWGINLSFPSFSSFMKYSTQRDLRKKLYLAFISRASNGKNDNKPLIKKMLDLRYKSAQMLGYKNYAELTISKKMAETPQKAKELIDQLCSYAKPVAEKEHQELCQFAKNNGCDYDLMNWDVSYWETRMRKELYDYSEEDTRQYFQFPKVLEGLFSLTHKLFEVTIKAADGEVPTWHPDVRFFNIFNAQNEKIASFFLDPYCRPATKNGGAWMNFCVGRERKLDGTIQLPVAYLVCNQTPPTEDKPSLMSFSEVITLFHEFGHGLQHMLTTIDDCEAAGICGVEQDAIEVASQFMENWCYQQETLQSMSSHIQTGEPIPNELFRKILSAKNYRSGSAMLKQCHYALTDLALYTQYDPNVHTDFNEIVLEQNKQTTILPPLPEDFFICSFSHIFSGGYGAGYYSYKWSEVLSADVFAAFEEQDLNDEKSVKEVGLRYRDTFLALGGSVHPKEVFERFRGRAPTTDALLRHSGLK